MNATFAPHAQIGPAAPAPPSAPAISMHGVTKRFGTTVALDNVSLSSPHGSICGLVGPNGAGKTTLVRLLLGLERPASGTIGVLGFDPLRDTVALRERIGYVPDTVHADRWMTGVEVLGVDPLSLEEIFKHMARAPSGRNEERSQS